MPTIRIPAKSLSALNAYELEILRLLANGHTAKSIASRLGRSETAINERLRDARRKTGIGSSRELARLLDAQKVWDKKIDLSRHGSLADSPKQPRQKGFEWTKGKLAMLIALPIAALGLALAAGITAPTAETAQSNTAVPVAQSPLIGRWSLDVERIPAKERPQSVTIVFDISSDQQWTTRVEIVGADGTKRYADSTAGLGGVPVKVSGNMGFVDTVSLRQPAANTLVMTLGKGGAPVATRVYTAANDGRSMTETIIWPGEEIPKMETTYFNRAG